MFFSNLKIAIKCLIPVVVIAALSFLIAWFGADSGDTISDTNAKALRATQRVVKTETIMAHIHDIAQARLRAITFPEIDILSQARDVSIDRKNEITRLTTELSTAVTNALAKAPPSERPVLEKENGLLNAILVPWHDIDGVPSELDANRPIAAVCGSGKRSGVARLNWKTTSAGRSGKVSER